MRRGSSSMYQQGSGLANKSVAVSKLIGNTLGDGLAGKSMLSNKSGMPNKSTRKVEGHDMARTSKTSFEQTVNNLKSKPNQKVLEDQQGLQEEIKYLEYELKLLKDKEILEREGVNELDNFLKDEIPINENILAMKNKYNATKAKLEQQLSSLTLKKHEAEEVLSTQKGEIDRLHQITQAHRKQTDERREDFRDKLAQVVKEITLASDQYAAVGEDNRRMHERVKRMNEDISTILREGEKEKVAEVRAAEQKAKKSEKFEEKFRSDREGMIEAAQQCEELGQLEDVNPLVKPMEDQNALLRKRIMLNEKQKSTADNTVAEIELLLNEEAREREIERQHKTKYLNILEDCRLEVQLLERENDNILKDRTLRAKKVLLKDMANDLLEKDDLYNLLTDRLRNLEQECSNLIQDKKELHDVLETQSKTEKELQEAIRATEESVSNSRSTGDSLKRVTEEIASDIVKVQDQVEKSKGRVPMVERDIERKGTTIHYLNKQVDLLKEIKSLDLEQLHMISQSGVSIQNVLNSFIKNWEKIKSM